jgi:hypothetical protein
MILTPRVLWGVGMRNEAASAVRFVHAGAAHGDTG